MPGINQIQVKPQIDLTFANALRSIVRQDPDVIMIGEIRDLETAQIAVQSALTGHLVLSTVHTNDAPSTMNRLLDMGVEDYLLTSTIIGILAQRLVRTLCAQCKEPYTALPEMVEQMGLRRFSAAARDHAVARQGLQPVREHRLHGTHQHHRNAADDRPPAQPGDEARERRPTCARRRSAEGMLTMYEDGLRKALQGVTTFEEVLRVTRERLMTPPQLTAFASPGGGASLPWGGPAEGMMTPALPRSPPPRGAGLPWGGPAGGLSAMPLYRYRAVNPAGEVAVGESKPPTRPRSSTACATRA